jgi:ankyrin repeat protein
MQRMSYRPKCSSISCTGLDVDTERLIKNLNVDSGKILEAEDRNNSEAEDGEYSEVEEGDKALHIESRNNNLCEGRTLIGAKANVNAIDRNSETTLQIACKHTKLPSIRALLRGGADVSIQNNNKASPLQIALCAGRDALI